MHAWSLPGSQNWHHHAPSILVFPIIGFVHRSKILRSTLSALIPQCSWEIILPKAWGLICFDLQGRVIWVGDNYSRKGEPKYMIGHTGSYRYTTSTVDCTGSTICQFELSHVSLVRCTEYLYFYLLIQYYVVYQDNHKSQRRRAPKLVWLRLRDCEHCISL